MDNNNGMIGMALGSWLVALAGGVLATVLLWVLGGWGFMQGAFIGLLVFVIFGGVISWIMTRPLPAPNRAQPKAQEAPAAAAVAQTTQTAPAAAPSVSDEVKVKPSKRLPGQEELSARKGDWKYENETDAKPVAKPVKKVAKKTAPATDSAERPMALSDAPRAGGADDLKKISGVGPKLEETLNSLGIWHFDQVAGLKEKDIAWVDERLRFKGRIERDDWVGQAKKLAAGG